VLYEIKAVGQSYFFFKSGHILKQEKTASSWLEGILCHFSVLTRLPSRRASALLHTCHPPTLYPAMLVPSKLRNTSNAEKPVQARVFIYRAGPPKAPKYSQHHCGFITPHTGGSSQLVGEEYSFVSEFVSEHWVKC
jgi:hypothetical protein